MGRLKNMERPLCCVFIIVLSFLSPAFGQPFPIFAQNQQDQVNPLTVQQQTNRQATTQLSSQFLQNGQPNGLGTAGRASTRTQQIRTVTVPVLPAPEDLTSQLGQQLQDGGPVPRFAPGSGQIGRPFTWFGPSQADPTGALARRRQMMLMQQQQQAAQQAAQQTNGAQAGMTAAGRRFQGLGENGQMLVLSNNAARNIRAGRTVGSRNLFSNVRTNRPASLLTTFALQPGMTSSRRITVQRNGVRDPASRQDIRTTETVTREVVSNSANSVAQNGVNVVSGVRGRTTEVRGRRNRFTATPMQQQQPVFSQSFPVLTPRMQGQPTPLLRPQQTGASPQQFMAQQAGFPQQQSGVSPNQLMAQQAGFLQQQQGASPQQLMAQQTGFPQQQSGISPQQLMAQQAGFRQQQAGASTQQLQAQQAGLLQQQPSAINQQLLAQQAGLRQQQNGASVQQSQAQQARVNAFPAGAQNFVQNQQQAVATQQQTQAQQVRPNTLNRGIAQQTGAQNQQAFARIEAAGGLPSFALVDPSDSTLPFGSAGRFQGQAGPLWRPDVRMPGMIGAPAGGFPPATFPGMFPPGRVNGQNRFTGTANTATQDIQMGAPVINPRDPRVGMMPAVASLAGFGSRQRPFPTGTNGGANRVNTATRTQTGQRSVANRGQGTAQANQQMVPGAFPGGRMAPGMQAAQRAQMAAMANRRAQQQAMMARANMRAAAGQGRNAGNNMVPQGVGAFPGGQTPPNPMVPQGVAAFPGGQAFSNAVVPPAVDAFQGTAGATGNEVSLNVAAFPGSETSAVDTSVSTNELPTDVASFPGAEPDINLPNNVPGFPGTEPVGFDSSSVSGFPGRNELNTLNTITEMFTSTLTDPPPVRPHSSLNGVDSTLLTKSSQTVIPSAETASATTGSGSNILTSNTVNDNSVLFQGDLNTDSATSVRTVKTVTVTTVSNDNNRIVDTSLSETNLGGSSTSVVVDNMGANSKSNGDVSLSFTAGDLSSSTIVEKAPSSVEGDVVSDITFAATPVFTGSSERNVVETNQNIDLTGVNTVGTVDLSSAVSRSEVPVNPQSFLDGVDNTFIITESSQNVVPSVDENDSVTMGSGSGVLTSNMVNEGSMLVQGDLNADSTASVRTVKTVTVTTMSNDNNRLQDTTLSGSNKKGSSTSIVADNMGVNSKSDGDLSLSFTDGDLSSSTVVEKSPISVEGDVVSDITFAATPVFTEVSGGNTVGSNQNIGLPGLNTVDTVDLPSAMSQSEIPVNLRSSLDGVDNTLIITESSQKVVPGTDEMASVTMVSGSDVLTSNTANTVNDGSMLVQGDLNADSGSSARTFKTVTVTTISNDNRISDTSLSGTNFRESSTSIVADNVSANSKSDGDLSLSFTDGDLSTSTIVDKIPNSVEGDVVSDITFAATPVFTGASDVNMAEFNENFDMREQNSVDSVDLSSSSVRSEIPVSRIVTTSTIRETSSTNDRDELIRDNSIAPKTIDNTVVSGTTFGVQPSPNNNADSSFTSSSSVFSSSNMNLNDESRTAFDSSFRNVDDSVPTEAISGGIINNSVRDNSLIRSSSGKPETTEVNTIANATEFGMPFVDIDTISIATEPSAANVLEIQSSGSNTTTITATIIGSNQQSSTGQFFDNESGKALLGTPVDNSPISSTFSETETQREPFFDTASHTSFNTGMTFDSNFENTINNANVGVGVVDLRQQSLARDSQLSSGAGLVSDSNVPSQTPIDQNSQILNTDTTITRNTNVLVNDAFTDNNQANMLHSTGDRTTIQNLKNELDVMTTSVKQSNTAVFNANSPSLAFSDGDLSVSTSVERIPVIGINQLTESDTIEMSNASTEYIVDNSTSTFNIIDSNTSSSRGVFATKPVVIGSNIETKSVENTDSSFLSNNFHTNNDNVGLNENILIDSNSVFPTSDQFQNENSTYSTEDVSYINNTDPITGTTTYTIRTVITTVTQHSSNNTGNDILDLDMNLSSRSNANVNTLTRNETVTDSNELVRNQSVTSESFESTMAYYNNSQASDIPSIVNLDTTEYDINNISSTLNSAIRTNNMELSIGSSENQMTFPNNIESSSEFNISDSNIGFSSSISSTNESNNFLATEYELMSNISTTNFSDSTYVESSTMDSENQMTFPSNADITGELNLADSNMESSSSNLITVKTKYPNGSVIVEYVDSVDFQPDQWNISESLPKENLTDSSVVVETITETVVRTETNENQENPWESLMSPSSEALSSISSDTISNSSSSTNISSINNFKNNVNRSASSFSAAATENMDAFAASADAAFSVSREDVATNVGETKVSDITVFPGTMEGAQTSIDKVVTVDSPLPAFPGTINEPSVEMFPEVSESISSEFSSGKQNISGFSESMSGQASNKANNAIGNTITKVTTTTITRNSVSGSSGTNAVSGSAGNEQIIFPGSEQTNMAVDTVNRGTVSSSSINSNSGSNIGVSAVETQSQDNTNSVNVNTITTTSVVRAENVEPSTASGQFDVDTSFSGSRTIQQIIPDFPTGDAVLSATGSSVNVNGAEAGLLPGELPPPPPVFPASDITKIPSSADVDLFPPMSFGGDASSISSAASETMTSTGTSGMSTSGTSFEMPRPVVGGASSTVDVSVVESSRSLASNNQAFPGGIDNAPTKEGIYQRGNGLVMAVLDLSNADKNNLGEMMKILQNLIDERNRDIPRNANPQTFPGSSTSDMAAFPGGTAFDMNAFPGGPASEMTAFNMGSASPDSDVSGFSSVDTSMGMSSFPNGDLDVPAFPNVDTPPMFPGVDMSAFPGSDAASNFQGDSSNIGAFPSFPSINGPPETPAFPGVDSGRKDAGSSSKTTTVTRTVTTKKVSIRPGEEGAASISSFPVGNTGSGTDSGVPVGAFPGGSDVAPGISGVPIHIWDPSASGF